MRDTKLIKGAKKVLSACNEYFDTCEAYEDIGISISEAGSIALYGNCTTGRIYAIISSSADVFNPNEYLFKTDFVPFPALRYSNQKEMVAEFKNTAKSFLNEVDVARKRAEKSGKDCIFIYGYSDFRFFLGYSVLRKKTVTVMGCSEDYAVDFGLNESIESKDKCDIYFPSENLIIDTGMNIHLDLWQSPVTKNAWKKKFEADSRVTKFIDAKYTDASTRVGKIYTEALILLNKYDGNDINIMGEYSLLYTRIKVLSRPDG